MDTTSGLLLVAVLMSAAWIGPALTRRVRDRFVLRRRMAALARVVESVREEEVVVRDAAPSDANADNPVSRWLDQRFPLAGGMRTGLIAAGAGVMGTVLLVPALLFVGAGVVLGLGIAVGAGASAMWIVGNVRETRVRLRYRQRLLVSLEDFARMVRFGIGPGQALSSVASSTLEPVRSSLRQVTVEMGFGVPMAAALGREARRVRVSELAMLAAIISTQSQSGGGLAESVGNVAEMLRERLDMQARAMAETAESKISLIILSLVPFAALGLMLTSDAAIVSRLLGESRHLLGLGVGMIVCGLVVAWLIVRSART